MINLLNKDLNIYLDLNTFEVSLKKGKKNRYQIPINYYRTDKEWTLKTPYICSDFTEHIKTKLIETDISVRIFAPLSAVGKNKEEVMIDTSNYFYLNVFTSYYNLLVKIYKNNLKDILYDIFKNKNSKEIFKYYKFKFNNYKLNFEKEDWRGDPLEYNIFTSKNIEYKEVKRFLEDIFCTL